MEIFNNSSKEIDEKLLYEVTSTFKALGDPTRILILILLSKKEYSVNQIAESLKISQSSASHQLKILKNLKFVKQRRSGKKKYYSHSDYHVAELLEQTIIHIKHA